MSWGSAASEAPELPALLTQIISPPVLGTVCSAQTHFKEAALQQECFKKYNISICYSNSLCCGTLLMDYLPFFAPIRCKKNIKSACPGGWQAMPNRSCSPAVLHLSASPERKVQARKQLFLRGSKIPLIHQLYFCLESKQHLPVLMGMPQTCRAAQDPSPASAAPRD